MMTRFLMNGVGAAAILALMSACGPQPQTSEAPAQDDSALQAEATEAAPVSQAAPAPRYVMETLVPGGPFHGIHGLTFDGEGRLLAGSVVGRAIYEVDPETGETSVYIGPPEGMADDIEEGPDGTLAWTAFNEGKLYARGPDGVIRVLAEGLPGTNSLAFTNDGRLFFTQVFQGDALYEADLTGTAPPRKLMEGMGGLNGFDFGPDGKLYGPLWFKGQIVRVDVDTATLEVVADGFGIPAAANFNSKGELYAVDTQRGEVVRVDIETGARTIVATVPKAIDNLAFSTDDRLFLTVMADNAVHEVNIADGTAREVVSSPLSTAADIAILRDGESEKLLIADVFALRQVDLATDELSEIGRVFAAPIDYPIMVGARGTQAVLTSWASASLQSFDGETGALGTLHHGFGAILDGLPTDDGVLYLDFLAGSLIRASGDAFAARETIAEGLGGPVALAYADETSVYCVEAMAGVVSKLSLVDGSRVVIADGLVLPEGFDVAPDGTIVLAEVGRQRIVKIDPMTGEITPLADSLPIGLEGPAGTPPVNIPTGVAVASNGDILFSSDLDAAIYRLRPE